MRHLRTAPIKLLLLSAVLASLAPLALQAAPGGSQVLKLTPMTPLNLGVLQASIENSLSRRAVPADLRLKVKSSIAAQTPEVRQATAALFDADIAERIGHPEYLQPSSRYADLAARFGNLGNLVLVPHLDTVFPASGGSPDCLAFAMGSSFSANTEALVNSTAVPTANVGSGLLFFTVPSTAVLGSTVTVTARVKGTATASNALSFRIVALRGYRGVHGLSFPNFSATTIPWSVYREVFGPSNVEFGDGSHRPSAQTWYDSTYKGVGNGGNCFGMSQLSLRTRKFSYEGDTHALDRVVHGAWVGSTITYGAWTLPWNNTSKEAVQSLQGLQLVDPMATYISNQRASQDNKSAWTFANNSYVSEHRPVQNTLYGHAVVTYTPETNGGNRLFDFYDNNHPYSETETGATNPDQGVTNWSTGGFSYHSYTNTRCYALSGLMGAPTLPAGVGGDHAAEGSSDGVVRFEVPRVEGLLINDETGRGGPDGTGVPGLSEVIPEMGLGPIPASFPRIFLLNKSAGRTINFTVPGRTGQLRQLACYSHGGIILVGVNGGQTRASFSRLDQLNPQVELLDPRGAGLQQIHFVAPISRDEERELICDRFTGLGALSLGVSLNQTRGSVEIANPAGGQSVGFNLLLRQALPRAPKQLPAGAQTAAPGQLHTVGLVNWSVLQGAQLTIQRLALPAGRLRLR